MESNGVSVCGSRLRALLPAMTANLNSRPIFNARELHAGARNPKIRAVPSPANCTLDCKPQEQGHLQRV